MPYTPGLYPGVYKTEGCSLSSILIVLLIVVVSSSSSNCSIVLVLVLVLVALMMLLHAFGLINVVVGELWASDSAGGREDMQLEPEKVHEPPTQKHL